MKFAIFFVITIFCYAECRKTLIPIDKNANIAFINMEGGGGVRPGVNARPAQAPAATQSKTDPVPVQPAPAKPQQPVPATAPAKPAHPTPVQAPTKQVQAAAPTPAAPAKPAQQPNQIKPIPVNPTPVTNPITTPGPGSVKQLINFYDTQGKASPIRPYSYSTAVKQG